ncbi:MAG TPA: carbon-nitrogen hydrolase family protein [Candidatus Lokiarchaeia archaeon]|nr:carbon-nitrogen hydrolase family protein [Candidatus Lokiarchaeia archaeon]
MRKLKVGVIQSRITPYRIEENLARYDSILDECSRQDVDFVLLPEFFPTGNTLEPELLKYAIATFPMVDNWLASRSREHGITIAGACLVSDAGDVWNRCCIQEPDGTRVYHTKIESPAPEAIYYRIREHDDPVLSTRIGKIGTIICAESFNPEINGTDFSDCAMILMMFAIPNTFGRARPVYNRMTRFPLQLSKHHGVPVLVSSIGGPFHSAGSTVFPVHFKLNGYYAGQSGIYTPEGPVAGPIPGDEEKVLIANLDLGPEVALPDVSVEIKTGMPKIIAIPNFLFLKKARRIYTRNLKDCL